MCIVSIGTSRKIIDDEVITNNKNDSIPVPLAASALTSPTINQPTSQPASSEPVNQSSQTSERSEGVAQEGLEGPG